MDDKRIDVYSNSLSNFQGEIFEILLNWYNFKAKKKIKIDIINSFIITCFASFQLTALINNI